MNERAREIRELTEDIGELEAEMREVPGAWTTANEREIERMVNRRAFLRRMEA